MHKGKTHRCTKLTITILFDDWWLASLQIIPIVDSVWLTPHLSHAIYVNCFLCSGGVGFFVLFYPWHNKHMFMHGFSLKYMYKGGYAYVYVCISLFVSLCWHCTMQTTWRNTKKKKKTKNWLHQTDMQFNLNWQQPILDSCLIRRVVCVNHHFCVFRYFFPDLANGQ